jgi:hypothetical protein
VEVVSYVVADETTVEPLQGFQPTGTGEAPDPVQAIGLAVAAARALVEKAGRIRPDGIQVRFGYKANGEARWLVAQAAGAGNFRVTLTWSRDRDAGISGI